MERALSKDEAIKAYTKMFGEVLESSQVGFAWIRFLSVLTGCLAVFCGLTLISGGSADLKVDLFMATITIVFVLMVRFYRTLQGQVVAYRSARFAVEESFMLDVAAAVGLSAIEVHLYMPKKGEALHFGHVYLMVWDARRKLQRD